MSPNKRVNSSKKQNKKRVIISPVSSEGKCPIWVFTNIDNDGAFAFNPSREDFDSQAVLTKIIEYSNMTWSAIRAQRHDDNKSKHHEISYDKLSPEALKRFKKKMLDSDSDSLFSFAFTNRLRIIGIRDREYFKVLWYDPKHDVCPSKKKHT